MQYSADFPVAPETVRFFERKWCIFPMRKCATGAPNWRLTYDRHQQLAHLVDGALQFQLCSVLGVLHSD